MGEASPGPRGQPRSPLHAGQRLGRFRVERELGRGGGYILSPAKPPSEDVPVANIAAYLEEAAAPRL